MTTMGEMAVNFTVAFISSACGTTVMNPIETTMIRYQVTPNAKIGILDFGKNIIKTEGLMKGLWAPGIFAHGCGIGIGAIGRIGLYPTIRDSMLKIWGAPEGQKPYSAMVAAGFVAGGAGYFCCCPIFQVKTLAMAEHGKLVDGVYTTGLRIG